MYQLSMAESVKQRPLLHSQVIRIRAEEENIGNNIGERKISPKDRAAILHLTAEMKDVLVNDSKPIFPSPLGMKDRAWAFSVNR
ncbi:hypothetical protein SUGI_1101220 [Cryptomeria japonica]|nr:hypothetical protein SUGI_1101220 [Cryptomeria japonica]